MTEILVISFGDPSRQWLVSPEGLDPFWSPGGDLSFIVPDTNLVSVEVRPRGEVFEWGQPQPLGNLGGFSWTRRTADRILSLQRVTAGGTNPLRLLTNWPALLAASSGE